MGMNGKLTDDELMERCLKPGSISAEDLGINRLNVDPETGLEDLTEGALLRPFKWDNRKIKKLKNQNDELLEKCSKPGQLTAKDLGIERKFYNPKIGLEELREG